MKGAHKKHCIASQGRHVSANSPHGRRSARACGSRYCELRAAVRACELPARVFRLPTEPPLACCGCLMCVCGFADEEGPERVDSGLQRMQEWAAITREGSLESL